MSASGSNNGLGTPPLTNREVIVDRLTPTMQYRRIGVGDQPVCEVAMHRGTTHPAASRRCPRSGHKADRIFAGVNVSFCGDTVAKVENRTMPKISRRSIVRRFYRYKAP